VVITPAMDPKDQYMVEIKSSAANALVRVEMWIFSSSIRLFCDPSMDLESIANKKSPKPYAAARQISTGPM